MGKLSVSKCVRFGWETFKKRPWFIIGAVIIMFIFSLSFSYKTDSLEELKAAAPFMVLVGLISTALSIAVEILFTRFLLKAHDSVGTMAYMDTLPARPFWKYVGGKLAVAVVVIIGLILLIVPGIIALVALLFTPYLIVDRKLWPIEAMKESARITKGHRWQIFGLVLVLFGLNILGALALVIGLLVTVPISMLAIVHAYRFLEHKANELAPANPVAPAA